MGIGGVAMGNAALLAKQQGDVVLGTDGPIYSPMKEALAGLEIYTGYDAARLEQLRPEAIVIGNTIGRGNVELEWYLANRPCRAYTMPEFLYERVLKNRRTIAVCGTHGKTTTTALCAYLLEKAGKSPGWFIGGVPQDLEGGAHVGAADAPFVIEGDEYNSCYCDARAKFVSYRPTVALLNNIEPDHLDIYRDIDDIKRAFFQLLKVVPGTGVIIANYDDANVRSLLPVKWAPVIWVSAEGAPEAQLQIKNYHETETSADFELFYEGALWTKVSWGLCGLFNARNAAMAALAAAWSADAHNITTFNLGALENFVGVKRRQQVRFKSQKLVVVEDFAHHPTAVASTLESLKKRFPSRHWIACLEPRSGTARSNAHQQTFPPALAKADEVLLAPVYAAEKLAPEKRLNLEKLSADIEALGVKVTRAKSCDELPALLEKMTAASSKNAGVVFFSSGSFEGAMDAYLAKLGPVPQMAISGK